MIAKAITQVLLANSGVSALVGNRIDANILKQDTAYPAIYVSTSRMSRLGCSKDSGIRQGVIEVGVYADSLNMAGTIAEAIRSALDEFEGVVAGFTPQVAINIMSAQDTGDKYDDQAKKHVKIIEYDAIGQIYA